MPKLWEHRRRLAPACALVLLATTAILPVSASSRGTEAQTTSTSTAGSSGKRDADNESRSKTRETVPSNESAEPASKTDKALPALGEPAQKRPEATRTVTPPPPAPTTSGIQPSAYTGSYYRAAYESFRRCVIQRESRGDYSARNPRSSASGAYQFLLSTSNEVARMMGRPDLVGRPAGTWTRYEQDQAFYTLFDHGRGISHWGGRCG